MLGILIFSLGAKTFTTLSSYQCHVNNLGPNVDGSSVGLKSVLENNISYC